MEKLDSSHISYKCPLRWDEVEFSETGSFCDHCNKKVYDLRDCTLEEAQELEKKHGSLCGIVPIVGLSALLALSACSSTNETLIESEKSKSSEVKPLNDCDKSKPSESRAVRGVIYKRI